MADETSPDGASAPAAATAAPKTTGKPAHVVLLADIPGIGSRGCVIAVTATRLKEAKAKAGEHYRKAGARDLRLAGISQV